MEDMLSKVLKMVDSTYSGVKEMRSDLYNMSKLVNSYSTLIKELEAQINKISISLNPIKKGPLPSNIIANLKDDHRVNRQCMGVTTRSGHGLIYTKVVVDDTPYEQESLMN